MLFDEWAADRIRVPQCFMKLLPDLARQNGAGHYP